MVQHTSDIIAVYIRMYIYIYIYIYNYICRVNKHSHVKIIDIKYVVNKW